MDRRDILADNPVEKRRGYMPGVSVHPGRAVIHGRHDRTEPDGTIVPGGMATQTQRTMERLQAILAARWSRFFSGHQTAPLYYGHGGTCQQWTGRPRRFFWRGSTHLHGAGGTSAC